MPGIYRATLRRVCEDGCLDELGPYAALADDWRGYLRDHDEAMVKTAAMYEDRLSDGKTLVVRDYQLGNHDVRLPRGVFPGVHMFRVDVNDVVRPDR